VRMTRVAFRASVVFLMAERHAKLPTRQGYIGTYVYATNRQPQCSSHKNVLYLTIVLLIDN
jgi:hypothetical protein